MASRPASLKVRALQWLAQREHSRLELRQKLLRLLATAATDDKADAPAAAAEVDTLLDWLATRGYLNDQRFVESRVHARQARFGTLRIQRELQQHGTPLDAQAQQALRATEFERALAVWQRKFGGPATETTQRLRQMRFLAGRGFSPDVIRRVVRDGPAFDTD